MAAADNYQVLFQLCTSHPPSRHSAFKTESDLIRTPPALRAPRSIRTLLLRALLSVSVPLRYIRALQFILYPETIILAAIRHFKNLF